MAPSSSRAKKLRTERFVSLKKTFYKKEMINS